MARFYRHYVLGLLLAVYVFNFMDRQILVILQEPIARELDLTDTQLGSLTGLAFALFYGTLAIPIARLADRKSRSKIIAIALATWSLMTALSGLATSYISLLLLRMGVGVGEAGCVPAAQSILSDYFRREERATAIAILSLGIPLGGMIGLFAGGLLHDLVGWRWAFGIIGGIGLVLVPVVWLTLREPVRGALDPATMTQARGMPAPTLLETTRILWNLRSFRHLTYAAVLQSFLVFSITNWNPPFYARLHGLSIAEIALALALFTGIAGGLGTFAGGRIADRMGRTQAQWYMWVPAAASLAMIPIAAVQYIAGDLYVSLAAAAATLCLSAVYFGPVLATSQSLVSANMRATTGAILLLIVNIVGLGLGPLTTGAISDLLSTRFGLGSESLKYALLTVLAVAVWAAYHFVRSGRYLVAELPQQTSS